MNIFHGGSPPPWIGIWLMAQAVVACWCIGNPALVPSLVVFAAVCSVCLQPFHLRWVVKCFRTVVTKAAELESVGDNRFGWSRGWSWWNLAGSESGRGRRLTSVSGQWFWTNDYTSSRKYWKTGRNGEQQCVDEVQASFIDRIPRIELKWVLVLGIILGSSRSLCDYSNKFKDCHTDYFQSNQR